MVSILQIWKRDSLYNFNEKAIPISTMASPIKGVPADIFRIILSHIDPVDYLKVKLVSKDFSTWASAELNWKGMTKTEVITGHTNLEAGSPWGRRLTIFICTHCGLVKPKHKFSDNQAVKNNPKRICISCGISDRIYTRGQMPKVNGEECIPCWHCKKAIPKYNGWEETLVSGKAELTKILEGSRTGGHLARYATADGRTLDWSREIRSLAFCKPCLDRMMHHKEAALWLRQSLPDVRR